MKRPGTFCTVYVLQNISFRITILDTLSNVQSGIRGEMRRNLPEPGGLMSRTWFCVHSIHKNFFFLLKLSAVIYKAYF